jgi:hypothetical protein
MRISARRLSSGGIVVTFDNARNEDSAAIAPAYFNITNDQVKRIRALFFSAEVTRDERQSFEKAAKCFHQYGIALSLQCALSAVFGKVASQFKTRQLDAADIAALFAQLAQNEWLIWCELDARAMNDVSQASSQIVAALKRFATSKLRYAIYINAVAINDVSIEATKIVVDEIMRRLDERTKFAYAMNLSDSALDGPAVCGRLVDDTGVAGLLLRW